MTPDVDLMRLYGTEVVFREKTAAGVPPLPVRILNAIVMQQLAKGGIAQHEDQRAHDEQRNRVIQALLAMELAQANAGLRHTHVPVILGADGGGGAIPGMNVPLGLDEGMVRMAEAKRPPAASRPGQGEIGNDPFPFSNNAVTSPNVGGNATAVGLDAGMIRMASQVIGAGVDLVHLDKEAGYADLLGRAGSALAGAVGRASKAIGSGVSGLGKGLGGAASAATAAAPKVAPTMAMSPKTMGRFAVADAVRDTTPAALAKTMPATPAAPTVPMGPAPSGNTGKVMGVTRSGVSNPTLADVQQAQHNFSQLSPEAQNAINNNPLVKQHGMAPHAAASLMGASANPGESMEQAVMRHAQTPINAAKPPAPAAAAAAAAPVAASKPAAGAPPKPPGGGPPSQPPIQAAPGAPQPPGTLQRIGNDLGGGQWKWKVPMLGAAALGTYGAYKGLQKGLEYMSGEAHPRRFNEGAPQLAYGVNEYGYPQLGTPLQ